MHFLFIAVVLLEGYEYLHVLLTTFIATLLCYLAVYSLFLESAPVISIKDYVHDAYLCIGLMKGRKNSPVI